jgi:hypothetical protein
MAVCNEMRVHLGLKTLLRLFLLAVLAPVAIAQRVAPNGLNPEQATKLAALMCREISNVATILEIIQGPATNVGPAKDPPVTDDVYDTLVRLGPYSLPCLVDRLTDTRWMPDPRSEPLLGVPVVGDVAHMILADKGVHDVLPELAHKKPHEMRMDDYFLWPSIGNHRLRLQDAVRSWLLKHPNCCTAPPIIWTANLSVPKLRMSPNGLARARIRFSELRPGMSRQQVLRMAGEPDDIDHGIDGSRQSGSERLGLLGFCSGNHNEKLAYIYFTERWTDHIAQRDPLRDRYIILFFSAEGKFTRMFSTVASIPPIFPSKEAAWQRLMWEPQVKKK